MPARAQGKLNVVTTTEDLASIAREVGGDRITVESIAQGYQDPHFVEAKPSFILKLQKADLLVVVGRELEIGWLPPLIQQSRNAKIQPGARRVSRRVAARAHPRDSRRARSRARWATCTRWATRTTGSIRRTASGSRKDDRRQAVASCGRTTRAYFEQRLADFTSGSTTAEKRWLAAMAPYKGTKVVTYHRSLPNFAERFGLDVIGYVEPQPGIPPSPQHTLDLINEMKRQNVKLDPGRAVLRSEDAERDRPRDRRAGAGACRRRSAA